MLLRLGLLLSSGWLMAYLWGAADAQFSGTVFARNPSAAVVAQMYSPPTYSPPVYSPPAYAPPSPPQPPVVIPAPPPVQQPVWESPTYYPSRNYPTTYYR
jgi:hypothetical protein